MCIRDRLLIDPAQVKKKTLLISGPGENRELLQPDEQERIQLGLEAAEVMLLLISLLLFMISLLLLMMISLLLIPIGFDGHVAGEE